MTRRGIVFGPLAALFFVFLALSAQAQEPDLARRLARGEIIAQGGYQGKAVWGRMEGVVEAPPQIVWQIFIEVDRWKDYRFPNVADSRFVNAQIARAVRNTTHADRFYRVLGNQVIPLSLHRRPGALWTGYTFHYYDLPWPVADRWMIFKVLNQEEESQRGRYRAEWTKAAGNVRSVEGYLLVEPFANNPRRTRLEYKAESDPGAHIPRFILKWGVERTMPEIIRSIRREAARRLGRSSSS